MSTGVLYVLQPQSQMETLGYNTLIYGWDANHILPTLMHPNELLDGCMVSGSFMPTSSKISTYEFAVNPMIKRLYAQHGKTINFLGVLMSTLNVKMDEKVRCVKMAGQIAASVGAKGAVVVEEGYGNPDVDYTAMLVELERLGIKTVGLSDECTRARRQFGRLGRLHKARRFVCHGEQRHVLRKPHQRILHEDMC